MFLPQRVVISRQGSDDAMRGVVMALPKLGESLQMFLETGTIMQTSPVTKVEDKGAEVVVDTLNSRYRLKQAS